MPQEDEILPLIEAAKRRKEEIRAGAKSGDGEKPLQEAIWLAEALMNSERGDATRYGERWITGTVSYSFPVFIKSDGSVWLYETDLYAGYDEAMQQIETTIGPAKVYELDHELGSIADGMATMVIEWSDKDPDSLPTEWPGNGVGCYDVYEASSYLTYLLKWNFHGTAPTPPAFYTTIYPIGPYAIITTNQSVQPNIFGYIGYYGTPMAQGGAALLYNGPNGSNVVCFPAAYERLVIAREVLKGHLPALQVSGNEIIKEYVDVATYFSGNQWDPYYPMGFYHHNYHYKVGRLMRL